VLGCPCRNTEQQLLSIGLLLWECCESHMAQAWHCLQSLAGCMTQFTATLKPTEHRQLAHTKSCAEKADVQHDIFIF
jgi:hypothetical protein